MRQRKQIQWETAQRVVTDGGEKTRTHSDSKGMGGESFYRETCQMVQRPTRIRKGGLVPEVRGNKKERSGKQSAYLEPMPSLAEDQEKAKRGQT